MLAGLLPLSVWLPVPSPRPADGEAVDISSRGTVPLRLDSGPEVSRNLPL